MRSKNKKVSPLSQFFNTFSEKATRIAGKPVAFIVAFLMIIVWVVTGPIFHYSDTWQLVINTGTTIITFLMVFLIQQTQNKDTMAVHLKLNELIASNANASNRLVDVEDLTEEELEVIKKFYIKISRLAKNEKVISTHSLSEAEENQQQKSMKRSK